MSDPETVLSLAPSTNIDLPDLRPAPGSPADAPDLVAPLPDDPFFTDEPYFGAFTPSLVSVPWYAGWAGTLIAVDIEPGQWAARADLPVAIRSAAAASDGTLIRVFGGMGLSDDLTDHHQTYDPEADLWRMDEPLPVPVDFAMAAHHDGFFHVMGGNDSGGKTPANGRTTPPRTPGSPAIPC